MEKFTQTLELVSFTSNTATVEICRLLASLKYPFTVSKTFSCLTKGLDSESKTIFVFLLDSTLPQQLSLYLYHNLTPYLAIFCTPPSNWDLQIMQLSKDFCSWPCQEQELDFRLKHLFTQSEKNNSECLVTLPDDQWICLNLVGNCPGFLKVKSLIHKCAQCDAPVLLEGETGTGKDGVARVIHYLGDRRERPFVPVNCGALPDSLV